jgi:hypothetical protein
MGRTGMNLSSGRSVDIEGGYQAGRADLSQNRADAALGQPVATALSDACHCRGSDASRWAAANRGFRGRFGNDPGYSRPRRRSRLACRSFCLPWSRAVTLWNAGSAPKEELAQKLLSIHSFDPEQVKGAFPMINEITGARRNTGWRERPGRQSG